MYLYTKVLQGGNRDQTGPLFLSGILTNTFGSDAGKHVITTVNFGCTSKGRIALFCS